MKCIGFWTVIGIIFAIWLFGKYIPGGETVKGYITGGAVVLYLVSLVLCDHGKIRF